MSTSINISFVRMYEREVHHLYQRMGGFLRPTVRMKTNVVGRSTTFQVIGKGSATTKARHGVIAPMNQDHTAVECLLEDFYAGDWVDKLDEAKINHDEREAIAKGGAWALGRRVDTQIISALDSTTQSIVAWTTTSAAAIENALLEMSQRLDSNDVMNDGMRYGALTPRAWAFAMKVETFSSSDYVGADGMSFTTGAPIGMNSFKRWQNILWTVHSGLPGAGTGVAKVFAWHKMSIGYATGRHAGNVAENQAVSADITWHGDRAAHFVNHMMSGGECLIDTTGVIEGNLDDTAALPTA